MLTDVKLLEAIHNRRCCRQEMFDRKTQRNPEKAQRIREKARRYHEKQRQRDRDHSERDDCRRGDRKRETCRQYENGNCPRV